MTKPTAALPRIAALDAARGLALVAMASYHFAWDLEFFGYLEVGTTAHGAWRLYARAIASSFLFIVGVSLVLARGRHPSQTLWRLLRVAAAALAISLVTRFAFPDSFIYFGILHQIALASLIGLAFLRLPAVVTAAAALVVVALPMVWQSAAFDTRLLAWIGFAAHAPRSNDYVPVFPFTGVVLAGVAMAGALVTETGRQRLAAIALPAWLRPVAFAGRHSLLVYLVHQPILIALVFAMTRIVPAAEPTPEAAYLAACARTCDVVRDREFCAVYCPCTLDRLVDDGRLAALNSGNPDEATRQAAEKIAAQCTADTEKSLLDQPR